LASVRRFLAISATTAVGLVLLLTFKSGRPPATVGNGTAAHAARTPGTGASPTPDSATSHGTRTGDGPVEQTPYGNVQVSVTVAGSRITAVKAIQLPNAEGTSLQISQEAEPYLRQEVLSAQSARIQIVSGATYTSEGYAASVQAALNKLGL
jgi:uncharacterized protein with FMN-binding domain